MYKDTFLFASQQDSIASPHFHMKNSPLIYAVVPILAVVVATVGVTIIFFLKHKVLRAISPVVIAVAACAVHYTGMFFVIFIPNDDWATFDLDAYTEALGWSYLDGATIELMRIHLMYGILITAVIAVSRR